MDLRVVFGTPEKRSRGLSLMFVAKVLQQVVLPIFSTKMLVEEHCFFFKWYHW